MVLPSSTAVSTFGFMSSSRPPSLAPPPTNYTKRTTLSVCMLLPTAFIPIVWLGLGQLVDTEGL